MKLHTRNTIALRALGLGLVRMGRRKPVRLTDLVFPKAAGQQPLRYWRARQRL